jgi:hypothetical protein
MEKSAELKCAYGFKRQRWVKSRDSMKWQNLLAIKDLAAPHRIVAAKPLHRQFEFIRTNRKDQFCAALGLEEAASDEQIILLIGDWNEIQLQRCGRRSDAESGIG